MLSVGADTGPKPEHMLLRFRAQGFSKPPQIAHSTLAVTDSLTAGRSGELKPPPSPVEGFGFVV